jgi:hypothetical protein
LATKPIGAPLLDECKRVLTEVDQWLLTIGNGDDDSRRSRQGRIAAVQWMLRRHGKVAGELRIDALELALDIGVRCGPFGPTTAEQNHLRQLTCIAVRYWAGQNNPYRFVRALGRLGNLHWTFNRTDRGLAVIKDARAVALAYCLRSHADTPILWAETFRLGGREQFEHVREGTLGAAEIVTFVKRAEDTGNVVVSILAFSTAATLYAKIGAFDRAAELVKRATSPRIASAPFIQPSILHARIAVALSEERWNDAIDLGREYLGVMAPGDFYGRELISSLVHDEGLSEIGDIPPATHVGFMLRAFREVGTQQ